MAFFVKVDIQPPMPFYVQTLTPVFKVAVPKPTPPYPTGDTHIGNYNAGFRHGPGQLYSVPTKRQYVDGFRYNDEKGSATIIYPAACGAQRYYVGGVRKGKRHGQGRQCASGNMTQHEGQWVDGQLHGPGKYTKTECGTIVCCEGTFINGRLEGWGWYSTSYGTKKSVFFQRGLVV
jgi:hypothetical protein